MDSKPKPKPKATAKNHTPLCRRDCDLSHHDLVAALFMDGRCVSAKIQCLGDLPTALKERIETAKKDGWDQDSEIPDPLEEMRNPLLLLACAFGKTAIVEGLLRNNFYPRAVNKHGETALHFVVMYLNKAATIMGGKLTIYKERQDTFERLLHVLTDHHPKILAARDNFGRTALHVSAENVRRSRVDKRKNASFHQFCLKSMIKRLLELEDDAIFTRAEIIEVIKTAEVSNGDSILHMLAQNSPAGFEVLKFVQNLLFPGKAMPREKNKKNETVLSLAWETDPRNAVKIFSVGPQQAESSTNSTTHLEETLISNDKEVSTEVENVDVMEPERNFSDEEESTYVATGQPQLFEDDSVPYITQVFSLSNENCLDCEETSDSNKLKDLITPGRVKDESQFSEVIPTGLSNVKTLSDADNSFLEFVITEGVALDALAKQNIVEVVLKQYSDKLSQVEDRLPKLGQLMSEEEMALSLKKDELALLKQEIVAKERSLEELKQMNELLCEERKKLKRKVAHCHATEHLLEIKSRKCRSM